MKAGIPAFRARAGDTRRQGRHWEQVAERILHKHGLKTLKRNYFARFGEIDLVLLDGETLVFVEVRFRAGRSHGSGADSITRSKQQRIVAAARYFLMRERGHALRPCRFDVVSIEKKEGRTVVDWIRSAFEAG